MNTFKIIFKGIVIVSIIFLTALSCEQEDPEVGYGLLNQDEANANRSFIDLVAYNLFNGDSIRSDEDVLNSAVVGVFDEGVFGKVKASYVTQLRLASTNPEFSDSIEGGLPKATVDSTVLYITTSYDDDDDYIDVDTIYTDLDGLAYDQDDTDDVDTFRIVTKYSMSGKYGNYTTPMNLEVNTVSQFLGSIEDIHYSNSFIADAIKQDFLGSASIDTIVTGIKFRDSDGTDLDSINGNYVEDVDPAIRVSLDKDFFQNNIVNKQGTNDLSDQARFIQYMKGIVLSVSDANGFIFNFAPSNVVLSMYYTYTNAKDDDGDVDEGSTVYNFSLSSAYNVRIGLYERDASQSSYLSAYTGNGNTTGDSQLFLDGLGGMKTIVKFDQTQIDQYKYELDNNRRAIVNARLKLYKDPISSSLEDATRIFAYKYKDSVNLPLTVSDLDRDNYEYLDDMSVFLNSFNPSYDSDNDYYQINVTEYVKNIVEKDSTNYPLIIEMGDFSYDTSGNYNGVLYTNKPYNPFRMAFKGSNLPSDDERLRLEILYTDK